MIFALCIGRRNVPSGTTPLRLVNRYLLTSLGREGGGLLGVGDLILMHVNRRVVILHTDRTLACLPGAKAADIVHSQDRLIDRSEAQPVASNSVGSPEGKV